jgi:Cdc6-like AAA superfamily ATPase
VKLAQAFIIFDRLLIERRGRGLEPIEREILTAAWEQETYQQIQSYQEQTVKNKAGRLWQDLSQLLGIKITKQNIPQILANWDIDRLLAGTSPPLESPYRTNFCGRLSELLVLQSTIELAQQRSLCLYGMQGIGKTALIHQFTEQWASKFDRIVWISLQRMTPLIDTLEIVIRELGGSKQQKYPNVTMAIDRTLSYLQQQRCLLVFDRADAIFDEDSSDGLELKSDYLNFFDRLDQLDCQSFCIIISITKLTQITCQNRSLELKGLDL